MRSSFEVHVSMFEFEFKKHFKAMIPGHGGGAFGAFGTYLFSFGLLGWTTRGFAGGGW